MKIKRWIKKQFDKLPECCGLIRCRGSWRVLYPDGRHTHWTTYDVTLHLKDIFGGEIQYRPEIEEDYKNDY